MSTRIYTESEIEEMPIDAMVNHMDSLCEEVMALVLHKMEFETAVKQQNVFMAKFFINEAQMFVVDLRQSME
jgi:hypothetical protein